MNMSCYWKSPLALLSLCLKAAESKGCIKARGLEKSWTRWSQAHGLGRPANMYMTFSCIVWINEQSYTLINKLLLSAIFWITFNPKRIMQKILTLKRTWNEIPFSLSQSVRRVYVKSWIIEYTVQHRSLHPWI